MPRYPPGPHAVDGIAWIDAILNNGGMADGRKRLTDLVLAPYLVNIKQYDYEDAYNRLIDWLDRCSQKSRLGFNARLKIRYALQKSRMNGIRPLRFRTVKDNYSDLYQEVVTA